MRAALVIVAFAALAIPSVSAALERRTLPSDVTPAHYDVHIFPDPKALTFRGEATVAIDVHEATDRITLNAAELTIDSAAVDGRPAAGPVAVDQAAETITVRTAAPLKPGRHSLRLAWRGTINRSTSAFFAVDYEASAGVTKRILATKFEPAAARRFMPLWDEPARKATYTLSADVSAADAAFSNMPIRSETPLADGRKRVTFAETPKMSSYLLFFASGDLERISRKVDGTDIGVVVRRGATAKAAYALDAASQLLGYYNDYFGVRYALPKLDLMAAPGVGSFGAMENWGAIFFFERRLLVDPATSTEADRRSVYAVIAHEMAHMWFGDLVTMNWWNDLWLNEGFASWMEGKATQRFHPDWKPGLIAQLDREDALGLDALSSTHPVVQDVVDGPAANQAFDGITYGKGQAVIGMLEGHVGADRFRDGVRAYMRRHAYGNTVSDDLWSAIEAASGTPVKSIAADFLEQPGVPLVRVEGDGRLGQARFSFEEPVPTGQRWTIPLAIAPLDGKGEARHVLLPPEGMESPVPPPFIANAGQASYARVAYTEAAFDGIVAAFRGLADADQLGLLLDGWALGKTSIASPTRPLQLVEALPADAEPLVWISAVDVMTAVDRLYADGAERKAWRGWALDQARRPFARLGWDAKPGEPQNDAILREDLLRALDRFGDMAIAEEARRRYAAYLKDPASLSPALVKTVMAIVAANATSETYPALHERAVATIDPQAKADLYAALSGVRDPAVAEQVLKAATGGEISPSIGSSIVAGVARQHPDLAWRHALATEAAVLPGLDLRQRNQYLPRVAAGSSESSRADELHAVAEKQIPADARRFANQAETEIRNRARVVRTRLPLISRWIATRRVKETANHL
jgi:aminopeptidase N